MSILLRGRSERCHLSWGYMASCYIILYFMSIYLIRHCSAQGQEPEAALTEAGNEQALRLSAFLERRRVTRIVSSPFRRAVDSARPLGETLGLEVEIDPRLAERQLGLVENGDWRAALRESFDHCLFEQKGQNYGPQK